MGAGNPRGGPNRNSAGYSGLRANPVGMAQRQPTPPVAPPQAQTFRGGPVAAPPAPPIMPAIQPGPAQRAVDDPVGWPVQQPTPPVQPGPGPKMRPRY